MKKTVTGVTPGEELKPGDVVTADVNGNFRKAESGKSLTQGYAFVVGENHTIEGQPYNVVMGHEHTLFTGIVPPAIAALQKYIEEKLPAGRSKLGANQATFKGYFLQVFDLRRKYFEHVIEPYLGYHAERHECRIRYAYHSIGNVLNIWCNAKAFPEVQVAEDVRTSTAKDNAVDRFVLSGDWRYANED